MHKMVMIDDHTCKLHDSVGTNANGSVDENFVKVIFWIIFLNIIHLYLARYIILYLNQ